MSFRYLNVTFVIASFRNPLLSQGKHIALLILARGGSKGIPLKNLAKINDKTLLEITLNEVKLIQGISSVWVSTDHPNIAKEGSKGMLFFFV